MNTDAPKAPLRLAIVRQRYNPYGGAERFVARALDALGALALDVTLITRAWPKDAQSTYRILPCAPFHLGRLWRDWSFARGVQRVMTNEKFDLVQSHERIAGCSIFRAGDGVHATWLAQRARTLGPLARWAQKLSPWHCYTVQAEAAMFRHAALRAVICNSHMVASDIAQRFPETAGKLHVVHNGVDLERFTPALREQHRASIRAKLGVADNTPVIIYVGSGFTRKGLPQLLQALADAALHDTQLWVVGRDKGQAALVRQAQHLGIDTRVKFLGPIEDVAPYLAAADIFALPTLYDPMPNAALEALACGLPVLTSSASGAAEVIADLACSAVVDALSVRQISREARRLLDLVMQDPHSVAQNCRAAVSDMSQSDMAKRQWTLYKTLLDL